MDFQFFHREKNWSGQNRSSQTISTSLGLYQAYADIILYSLALTAFCVFQVLLLHKPHARSTFKDHVHSLECRHALVKEGKCIQDHLQCTIHSGP